MTALKGFSVATRFIVAHCPLKRVAKYLKTVVHVDGVDLGDVRVS